MFFSGIRCDICGREIKWTTILSIRFLTHVARKEGWTVGKYVKCPDCKGIKNGS